MLIINDLNSHTSDFIADLAIFVRIPADPHTAYLAQIYLSREWSFNGLHEQVFIDDFDGSSYQSQQVNLNCVSSSAALYAPVYGVLLPHQAIL